MASRFRLYLSAIKTLGWRGFVQRGRARRAPSGTIARVTARWTEHPLAVRGGSSDMWVFDQIFVDREYRCLDEVRGVRTIVDAGANVGYSAAYLLSRYADARIVCIEPDAENYRMLQRNLAPFGDRAALFHGALWSEPTVLDFTAGTTDAGKEWGRQVETSADGAVAAIDMLTLMKKYDMPKIDLLKIDIEGAEKQVFGADDVTWLADVANIVTELHGPECTETFMAAIGDRYRISHCDELTVCLS